MVIIYVFFWFFDRTPVSRDRDCCNLTEISEISGRHKRFDMRQRFDHFECGWLAGTSSRYSTGESPPIKAGHWGTIPHLESTCTRFNTSARRRTRPSAGPERSQQLQILPSLNSKAVLQWIRLLFLLLQHWRASSFSCAPTFLKAPIFLHAPRFWHPPKILDAPMFWYPPTFLDAPMYIFFDAYIFVYFSAFLFSMRQ